MENKKRFAKATWQIMEQLLEADSLDTALSESLSIILREIGGEVGIIWLLDKNENRLRPVFYSGIGDISGISVDNGFGIAGTVTDSGKSVVLDKPHDDPRFDNSIFDEQGIHVRSTLCVPLYDLSKTIGCIQIDKNAEAYRPQLKAQAFA
ncbi:MAG: GAF domain-containing protein [Clostridia bacterium]|nr:GAF domain-containing protein [Clostridia bacterium]